MEWRENPRGFWRAPLANFSIVLGIFTLLFFSACSSQKDSTLSPAAFTGNRMTIDFRVLIGQELSDAERGQVWDIIRDTFNEVDRIYNKWNPHSEVSRLNKLHANVKANLSPELETLLRLVDRVVVLSGGRFDPTIEPAQKLWKAKLSQGQTPTQAEIERVRSAVGWDHIHFENGIFYKDHAMTSMDLGGIAKGLAVDLLVQRLNSAGFKDAYVDWGGEVRASGRHPEGRPWNVLITRFGNPDPAQGIAHLNISDRAVATSGDYEQFWTLDTPSGKQTYFHIIDPKTCRPQTISPNRVASATVCAGTCAFADGLATAAMMFDTLEDADAWTKTVLEHYPDTLFWLSTRKAAP